MKISRHSSENQPLLSPGNSYDWIILCSMLVLIAFGVLTIYSTSFTQGQILSSLYFRQIIYAVIGLVIFFLVSRLDYKIFAQVSGSLYFLTLLLLVVTFALGISTRGSTRWIDLSFFRLQPSEIIKPVLIAVLAFFYSTREKITLRDFLLAFFLMIIPAALIFRQPDLGSAIVLFGIWLIISLVAGVSWKYLASFGLVLLLVVPIGFNTLKDYQKERLTTFINPQVDPQGSGYNIIQSIIAVGSGQLSGRGFGRGTQSHLNFLPEQHTDFIFATMAEELGFVGTGIVLIVFLILAIRIINVARHSPDQFSLLLIVGILSMILLQLFINIGMNMGLLPVTGITLPFISFGGSSLVALIISIGLVEAVARFRKREFLEIGRSGMV